MLPRTLYKYQPITLHTLENLKAGSIWFSSPSAFNDPFDCAFQVIAPDLPQKDTERAIAWVRSHLPPEQLAQVTPFLEPPTAEFRQTTAHLVQQMFEKERSNEIETVGLSCLSAKNDDLLMWGHYADGHRGFCLEFDTSQEPFTHALPVNYPPTIPQFSPIDVLEGDVNKIVEALVLTKAPCWSYEQEWRIPHEASHTAIKYKDSALISIYFGAKTPKIHREIIALVLRDTPTKLYSMSIEPNSFTLVSHFIEPTLKA